MAINDQIVDIVLFLADNDVNVCIYKDDDGVRVCQDIETGQILFGAPVGGFYTAFHEWCKATDYDLHGWCFDNDKILF